jgi:hypothetical protein
MSSPTNTEPTALLLPDVIFINIGIQLVAVTIMKWNPTPK